MLKKISNLKDLQLLNKQQQQSMIGGRLQSSISSDTDCPSHYTFCDEAHPTDYKGFSQCMDSCGC